MSTKRSISAVDYDAVLKVVRKWPVATRFTLLHDVLRSLSEELLPEDQRRPRTLDSELDDLLAPPGDARRRALRALRGMLVKEGVDPPTDADIERWKEERLMKKYG